MLTYGGCFSPIRITTEERRVCDNITNTLQYISCATFTAMNASTTHVLFKSMFMYVHL